MLIMRKVFLLQNFVFAKIKNNRIFAMIFAIFDCFKKSLKDLKNINFIK